MYLPTLFNLRKFKNETVCLFLIFSLFCATSHAKMYRVYFGMYDKDDVRGIYAATLDTVTASLTEAQRVTEVQNAAYLAFSRDYKYLYAVGEMWESNVYAFCVEDSGKPEDLPKLELLKTVSGIGAYACHLQLDLPGDNLLVADYASSEIVLLPVGRDHLPGDVLRRVKMEGKGPNEQRQEGPHPHSVNVFPGFGPNFAVSDEFFYVPDLGTDKIMIYQMEFQKNAFHPAKTPSVSVEPGSGPRHMTFHHEKPYAYVLNELSNTVTVFKVKEDGNLETLQTILTLPEDFQNTEQKTTAAAIKIHPSGKYLYTSNRGHDSLATFQIGETGTLTFIETVSSGGKSPRDFAISPDGNCLLAANQGSNNVVIFAINEKTGQLQSLETEIAVSAPVCVVFVPTDIGEKLPDAAENTWDMRPTYPWKATVRNLGKMDAETAFHEVLLARVYAKTLEDLQHVAEFCEAVLKKDWLTDEARLWTRNILFSTHMENAEVLLARMEILAQGNVSGMELLLRRVYSGLKRAIELYPESGEAYMAAARIAQLLSTLQEQKTGGKPAEGEKSKFREEMKEYVRQAIRCLEKAERTPMTANQLGTAYGLHASLIYEEDAETALADLRKAMELLPEKKAEFQQTFVMMLMSMDKSEEAMKEADALIREAEAEKDLYMLARMKRVKALLYLESDNAEAALAQVREALEMEPGDEEMLQIAVRILAMLKRYDEALQPLGKLIEKQPSEAPLYVMRGSIYFTLEKYAEALADFEKAAVLSPGENDILGMKWTCMVKTGKTEEAVTEIESLLKLDPNNLEMNLALLDIYQQSEQYGKLMAKTGELIASQGLEAMLAEAGNDAPEGGEKAPEDRKRALAAMIYGLRANTYLHAGMHPEAAAEYEKAVKLGPKNALALNNLAWLYCTSPDDAVRDAKRALELATLACELTEFKNPGYLSTLGAAYAESGDFDTAMQWAKTGLELLTGEDDAETRKSLEQEVENYAQKKPMREKDERISPETLKIEE